MLYINIFGRMEYELTNKFGDVFFIEYRRGEMVINKRGPWYITRARISVNPLCDFCGDTIQPFYNFSGAVAYLKKNLDFLL